LWYVGLHMHIPWRGLQHHELPCLLGHQDSESGGLVAGGDDAVAHLCRRRGGGWVRWERCGRGGSVSCIVYSV
jgi:hypothetical protein